jgi:hypothetical protein
MRGIELIDPMTRVDKVLREGKDWREVLEERAVFRAGAALITRK